MVSTQDSWSNILPELVGLVLERLHAHVDRVRFAAVCPQWRSAARQVRLPPPLPLLALKDGETFYSMPGGEPLHFAGCTNGFTTTCGKWLVYRRFRDLLLVDPFSGATMTLPSPSRVYLPAEDGCVDPSSDCDCPDCTHEVEDSKEGHDSAYDGDDSKNGSAQSRVHLLDKDGAGDSRDGHDSGDNDEDSEGGHDSADEGDYSEDSSIYTDDSEILMDLKCFKVIKLMECSPNLFVALFKGSEFCRIAVCRPGGSKWSVAWGLSVWTSDMAFYQGKLYVVDWYEDLMALDISVVDKTGDPRVSRIREVITVRQSDYDETLLKMLYLVESRGSLMLVIRSVFHEHVHSEGQIHTFSGQCEPDILIFKADFVRSQWVKVTTLADDEALFLGPCSRSVCMPQGDSPGNRVWFLDDYKDFNTWDTDDILTPGTSSMTNPKPVSPLPMISWKGCQENAGAAWLFPAN